MRYDRTYKQTEITALYIYIDVKRLTVWLEFRNGGRAVGRSGLWLNMV